ncbi:MAG: undecaprenyldiphospho-muramoylpentapeptide beta-N-acetylglucosaminyltransferase [Bacteroidota bacterium]|jgi:UDP-N-acetylglucosamine--N-acetylmuramyl-(pentapeptide) pyrophosphoryl-undecaprenol N-acetylglucosamine transferase
MKVIISGGGTGGHIFPAIAIANEIKHRHADANILFVGAEDRMEMTRIPEAGYEIVGLPVAGFNRSNLLKNVPVLAKLFKSLYKARSVVKKFKPDVVVGVGGYASGPLLKMASLQNIPSLLQEQNSYPGVTNKLLARTATKICVAYEGMEAFFEQDKLVLTGNPIRQDLTANVAKEEACQFFNLDPSKKTILIIGGSLGALTVNRSILSNLSLLKNSNVQLLWQCGKRYHSDLVVHFSEKGEKESVHLYDFISHMEFAYAAADLVISRAGASSISELCVLAKPVILIPSPNVSEDHQTKNAMALVNQDAAVLVKDDDAVSSLLQTALNLVNDNERLATLSANIHRLALPNAASRIVDELEKMIKEK